MRRAFVTGLGLLAVLAAATLPSFSQAIVENPAKPQAANAGRVITPSEVLAISDEGRSDFYFKWPNRLATGPDGSLFIREVDQVLWFDKDGKLLGNLFKKGQGPGEMSYPGTPLSTDTHVVVFSAYPNKLVYFNRTGRYEKEIAIRSAGGRTSLSLIGYRASRFYFESGEFPRTTGDPDFVDNPRTIVAANEADGTVTSLATFVTRAWVVTSPTGGGGMFTITSLVAVPFGGRYLVLTHTEDYLIKLYDPAANKVVREFRRAYARIKGEPLTEAEKKGGIRINDKHYSRPERKFENDIKNILIRDGEIWAVTSTTDKAKGILIDVFDGEGVYRDCFWLKLPESALKSLLSPGQSALDGEFLWVVERSEDETFTIKKFKIEGQS
ncbi:MAG: hypothetical protein HGA24_06850 [Candidatus Aminicenantes bacterium]|nr:hypothetical protein [Candidatus Aminicenantes bacterium]